MKPIIPFALLGAFFAVGAAKAASTDPVGYISHTLYGSASGGLTLISPSLIQPTTFAGVSSVTPSGGSVITFTGGVPTSLDGTYVLEISGDGNEGWWSTVSSSTATTITVTDPFPSGLPADVEITVRKHNTVQSFLGENAPGLTPFDGVAQADEVQVINSSAPGQPITAIVYVPAAISTLPEDEWFDLGSSSVANDFIIEPGSSVLIKKFGAGSSTFVSSGEVKTTATQFDVFPGLNFVGSHVAVGTTLNGMGFNTQLNVFDGLNTDFDELQIIDSAAPSQPITAYAALDVSLGLGVTMGNLGTSADGGADPFAEGVGAFIKRDASKPATVITIPGSTVAP